ncbi:hypothetical protein J6590_067658 [Homalodisca vitripennis]|nr:hypothetical protein J6590_067658 [Homalodisca vitripennis]
MAGRRAACQDRIAQRLTEPQTHSDVVLITLINYCCPPWICGLHADISLAVQLSRVEKGVGLGLGGWCKGGWEGVVSHHDDNRRPSPAVSVHPSVYLLGTIPIFPICTSRIFTMIYPKLHLNVRMCEPNL